MFTRLLRSLGVATGYPALRAEVDPPAMAESTIGLRAAPHHPSRARREWRAVARPRDRDLRMGRLVNDDRLHSELGDNTPAEIEAAYYRDRPEANVA